jgi:hypothetical protein
MKKFIIRLKNSPVLTLGLYFLLMGFLMIITTCIAITTRPEDGIGFVISAMFIIFGGLCVAYDLSPKEKLEPEANQQSKQ